MDTLLKLSKCPYKGCEQCLCSLCVGYYKKQVVKMNGELVCYSHFINQALRVKELKKT